MTQISNLTLWFTVGLFSIFSIVCLILAIFVRRSTSKVTDPPFFNAFCIGIGCPGQTGTSTNFFEQEDGTYVTRNYCVNNAPTYKQLRSIVECSQNSNSPSFRFWHTNNRISDYSEFYEKYVNTCGPNWTYSLGLPTDLPSMPVNFGDNVNQCLLSGL